MTEVREVLGHAETWEKADIWTTLAQKVYTASVAEYKGFKNGEASSLRFYEGYARGLYLDRMCSMWGNLQKKDILEKAGFIVSFEYPHQKAQALDKTSALFVNEQQRAAHAWNTTFEIVRFRCQTHAHYAAFLQGKFAALVSADPGVVSATLGWCRRAWGAIQLFESKRHIYKDTMS